MKAPVSYYGGKKNMLSKILPLIPPHKIYCEPFFGGGAVFFAKGKAEVNVINDTNNFAVTFYEQAKNNFEALNAKIQSTLHSEIQHITAKEILKNSVNYEPLAIAWAFWVQTNMSFGTKIFGGFAYDFRGRDYSETPKKNFTKKVAEKLEGVQIFCRDALNVINMFDFEDTFFYLDPPYISSDCGYYSGSWTPENQLELIEKLKTIKGKFLLSGYPEDLPIFAKWNRKEFTQNLSISGKLNQGKTKTETLVFNYPETQLKLF